MSVLLRGKPISRGSAVYDLAYGPGFVRSIEPSTAYPIVVAFLGRADSPYSLDGRTPRLQQATLYTEPPAIVPAAGGISPVKWRLLMEAITTTLNAP